MKITGYTKLYGVIATPIKHSISPLMHNTAFNDLGIDATYLAFEVSKEHFHDACIGMKALDIAGFNVSMPYKEAIIEYLDDLTEVAKLIGAVNTVKNIDGNWIGHNTDGIGFIESLKDDNFDVTNKNVVMLGCGGAGKSIAISLALANIKELTIFNRKSNSFSRIQEIVDLIKTKTNIKCTLIDIEDETKLKEKLCEADLLINTTSIGMKPYESLCPIKDISMLQSHTYVADIIYNPKMTKLLEAASTIGCKYQNGLGMLLYQGKVAFEFWTGQEMNIEKVKEAVANS